MLDLLVKSAVRRKIIGLMAFNEEHPFYPQQIAKEIDESPHAVGLELRLLSKGGLLKTLSQNNRTYYQWNEKYPFAEALKNIVEKMREQGNPETLSLPNLTQRKRLEENLEKVLEGIKRLYQPEKIILFGSAASGKVGPHSDLDLVIIKKTTLPYFKRIEQLIDLLDYDVDIDFCIYTPEEFAKGLKQKHFFQKEILKKGKILYDKAA